MTAEEFHDALLLLRWTAGTVANDCGYSRVAGYSWLHGRSPVPGRVATWLKGRLFGRLDEPPAR